MHFYRTPVSTEYLAAIDAVYTSLIGLILLCGFIVAAVMAGYWLLMKQRSRIRETIAEITELDIGSVIQVGGPGGVLWTKEQDGCWRCLYSGEITDDDMENILQKRCSRVVHEIKVHLHVGACREECRGECSENREGACHE